MDFIYNNHILVKHLTKGRFRVTMQKDNTYISIVSNKYSYGGDMGLFEVLVTRDDVEVQHLGFCTFEDVQEAIVNNFSF